MKSETDRRASERGAVKIQTVLTFVVIGILAFVLIKVVPVYIEERTLHTEVDELARISAVRGLKQDQINKRIEEILSKYSTQERPVTITIVAFAENKVHLKLQYTVKLDFIVTQWDWAVDYTSEGKAL